MEMPFVDIEVDGSFGSRDEMERNATREPGHMAYTPHVFWLYDGREWVVLYMEQYITFEVVKRLRIPGKGHVTVIRNPDLLPIDRDRSAVCKGQFRLPIHGIELTMKPMKFPTPKQDWGLITSEETVGDFLEIRMYPDEDYQNVLSEYGKSKADADAGRQPRWDADIEHRISKKIREEYEQANNLIDYASRATKPINGGLISVDGSVRDFMKFLKSQLNIGEDLTMADGGKNTSRHKG